MNHDEMMREVDEQAKEYVNSTYLSPTASDLLVVKNAMLMGIQIVMKHLRQESVNDRVQGEHQT